MLTVARPPYLLRKLYPKCVWRMPANEKKIYLTFDDGPVPEVSNWVLDILKQQQIKATFFCVGENVKNNNTIYQQILADGHQTGNHTYNHIKGLQTQNLEYYENIRQCQELVNSSLFRPPYGQIKPSQQNYLAKQFKIIMWDVLSYDYSQVINKERCLNNVIKNTRNGSILVFHDSVKAFPNLEYALPRAIEFLKKQQYQFALF